MPNPYRASGRLFATAAAIACLSGAAHAQTFVDWTSALKPGATVTVSGSAQELTYTAGATGVTSTSAPSAAMDATFTEGLNGFGQISSLVIKNANRTVSFAAAGGDTIGAWSGDSRLVYARASDWTRAAIAADPTKLGWAYQSFGVWQTGVGAPTGSAGAASVGAATAGGGVPASGTAVFGGMVGGIYLDAAGVDRWVSGELAVGVDFAARTASVASTVLTDTSGKTYRDLAVSGTLAYQAGSNRLAGTLSTARLSGLANAQFYGPKAEEIGGTFILTPTAGNSLERFGGGFGARAGAPTSVPMSGFKGWSQAIKPASAFSVDGRSYEVTYNAFPKAGMISTSAPSALQETTFYETLSGAGDLTSMVVKTAKRTVGFYAANGDVIAIAKDSRFLYATASDFTRQALAADPTELEWEYQSFGVWQAGLGQSTGSIGASSVGAATAANLIQTLGTADFAGVVAGVYVSPSDAGRTISGDLAVRVNFADRVASLASTNMKDNTGRAFADLNLTGVLTYAAGQNELSGVIGSRTLAGPATAQFFGPGAEELGGVFALVSPGLLNLGGESFVGGFGAARQLAAPVGAAPGMFTSWAANRSAAVTQLGLAQQIATTRTSGRVTTAASPSEAGSATLVHKFDSGIRASENIVNAAGATTAFEKLLLPVLFDNRFNSLESSGSTAKRGVMSDPTWSSLNYQSFGAWETGRFETTGSLGAVSGGAATAVAALPGSGSSTFRGSIGGAYVDANGASKVGTGDVQINVDFGARRAAFASTALSDSLFGSIAGTAVSGTLTFLPGQNALTGTLSTTDGRLTGPGAARFYGPTAQELGGTFALGAASGIERLVAGFGAKR